MVVTKIEKRVYSEDEVEKLIREVDAKYGYENENGIMDYGFDIHTKTDEENGKLCYDVTVIVYKD